MNKFEHFSDHKIEKTNVQATGELLSTTLMSDGRNGWANVTPITEDIIGELEELTRSRDGWERAALQYSQGQEYYIGLLDQIANLLGPEAFTADDGGLHNSPIRAKLPEMIAKLVRK
jgi:hypothetical protein